MLKMIVGIFLRHIKTYKGINFIPLSDGEKFCGLVGNNGITSMAKNFGVDSYIPGSSNESLDDFVTNKAIDGLFTMIAQKESDIRTNPVSQTTSLLKQVFGK